MSKSIDSSDEITSTVAFVVFLLTNLVPVAGIVLWDWGGGALVMYYWFENVVVGLCTIPKIMTAGGQAELSDQNNPTTRSVHAFRFILFFGMFALAHAVLIVLLFFSGLFDPDTPPIDIEALFDVFHIGFVVGIAMMVVQHVTEALSDQRHLHQLPSEVSREPYQRLVGLHVVLIVGALALVRWDNPMVGLIILVALKMGIEMYQVHRQNR